jgi:hypothetical protein
MLNYYLTNPNIEGVYESNVPSEFRAISDIGSSCRMLEKTDQILIENLQRQNSSFDFINIKKNHIVCLFIELKGKFMALIYNNQNLYVLKH